MSPTSVSFFPQLVSKTTVQILLSHVPAIAITFQIGLRAPAPTLDYTLELLEKLLKMSTSLESDLIVWDGI